MFIKRYELTNNGKNFILKYKDEKYILNANNWEEADEEAKKIILKLRKENKEKNVFITWG